MRTTLTIVTLLTLYFLAGAATLDNTNSRLAAACQPPVPTTAHVAMWPISWGLTAGLKSGC